MKKNRPGVLLTVLCAETDADRFSEMILRPKRARLACGGRWRNGANCRREFTEIKTPFGEVTLKIGRLNGKVVQAGRSLNPAKKLAVRAKIPLKRIYEAVLKNHQIRP